MMSDKEFSELQLRATIVPQQVRWPAPEYLHWQKLHEVANEARAQEGGCLGKIRDRNLNEVRLSLFAKVRTHP